MFASRRLVTIVKVKQEAAHVFVIDLASAVCFILGNDLAGKNRKVILEEIITLHEKLIYIYKKHLTSPQYSEMNSFF